MKKLSVIITLLLLTWFALPVSVQTTIANNAADMASHIVMVADSSTGRTVTNLFTFDRGAAVPFAVGASSLKVSNLDADKLDGLDSTRLTWAEQTTTSTGTQNNFSITSGQHTVLYANNATLLTFTGFTAGTAGQHLRVISVGAGQVDLSHQSASSTAANRNINFATSALTSLGAGVGSAEFIYDSGTARWRMVFHEQGAWITATYSGANYTGTGGTWTVASGDINTSAYWLRGRSLTYASALTLTTTGAGCCSAFNVTNGAWGSFTATKQMTAGALEQNNGTLGSGYLQVLAAATTIQLARTAGNWTAAVTDNTGFYGELIFEVN